MELQNVVSVSRTFGISAQMLRYYERIGLIKSLRKEGYAYRVYDEAAVRRLQQIVILRKLQIPIKQIKDILENRDAVAVIEVFKQNIGELDEKITALSTVRSILARFVDELQEKADVQLKLDLLNDKSMISLVDSLSIPISRVKEKVSMEELNRASEQLDKLDEKNVKIVYRPPAVFARFGCKHDPSGKKWNARINAEAIAEKFIEDTDLFKLKPDMRVWGFTDGGFENGGWDIWITVPNDFEIPAPFKKSIYYGGWFATHPANWNFDFAKWAEESDKYQWCHHQTGTAEGYFNPFNIYGFQNIDAEITGAMDVEVLFPIREIGKMTEDEKTKIAEIDKLMSRGEPVEIDLTAMKKTNSNNELTVHFENDMMIMHRDDWNMDGNFVEFPKVFSCPIKIGLRAKTDIGHITIGFSENFTCIKWCGNNFFTSSNLNKEWSHRKCGQIPINKFIDIELIFAKEAMILKINGEPRYYGNDHEYIKAFMENPEFCMSGKVSVSTEGGSTVTVQSLRVTEL